MKTTRYTLSKRDKIVGIISGILLFGIISYGIYLNYSLKENPVYTKAVITKFYSGAKGKPSIRCEYYIGNIKYTCSQPYRRLPEEFIYIGDTCLIMYQKDNPANNRLVKDDNDRIIVTKRKMDTYEILEPFE